MTADYETRLGPFERRLYPALPIWLKRCWYVALHGFEGAGMKPRLKSGGWMWLLGGWLMIVSVMVLWFFFRAALLTFAAVATTVLFAARWLQRRREREGADQGIIYLTNPTPS